MFTRYAAYETRSFAAPRTPRMQAHTVASVASVPDRVPVRDAGGRRGLQTLRHGMHRWARLRRPRATASSAAAAPRPCSPTTRPPDPGPRWSCAASCARTSAPTTTRTPQPCTARPTAHRWLVGAVTARSEHETLSSAAPHPGVGQPVVRRRQACSSARTSPAPLCAGRAPTAPRSRPAERHCFRHSLLRQGPGPGVSWSSRRRGDGWPRRRVRCATSTESQAMAAPV